MRLILIVAAVIAGFYAIDKFLADQERKEIRQDAHRRYEAGERFLGEGKPRDAAVSFSRAHALERTNREYQIALASAQLAAGEPEIARATLDELLQDDSNDARANLLMARVLAARRQFTEADSYYHRAIYGTWPANSDRERANARLELAGMLARQRGKRGTALGATAHPERHSSIGPGRRNVSASRFGGARCGCIPGADPHQSSRL